MGSLLPDDEVCKTLFVGRPALESKTPFPRPRPAFGPLSLGKVPEHPSARQVSRGTASPRSLQATPRSPRSMPRNSLQDVSFDDSAGVPRQLSGEGSSSLGTSRFRVSSTLNQRDSAAVRFHLQPRRSPSINGIFLPSPGLERSRTQTMTIVEDDEDVDLHSIAATVAAQLRLPPLSEGRLSTYNAGFAGRGSVNATDLPSEQSSLSFDCLAGYFDRAFSAGQRLGAAFGDSAAPYFTLNEHCEASPDIRRRSQSEDIWDDGLETSGLGEFRQRHSESSSAPDQDEIGVGKFPTRWAKERQSGVLHTALDVHRKGCLRALFSWQGIVCSMIMMNTFIIALEAVFISSEDMRPFFEVVEGLFTMFYVFEVGDRMKRDGVTRFIYGEDWNWNIFDSLVTLLGVVDVVMPLFHGNHKHNGTNVGRVFRVLRILRLFRAGRFLSDVDYVLTMAFSATLKLVAVVTLVLLVFAIIATNLLWDAEETASAEMFKDLASSMWTLFRIMTLDDWVAMVEPIIQQEPDTKLFFVVFIFFGAIALMSLVPTIFIQLKMDQDERQKKKMEVRREWKKQVRDHETLDALFTFIDSRAEGCGIVSSSVATGIQEDDAELVQVARERKLDCEQIQEMVHDVQLGIFRVVADHDGEDVEMDEDDFHNILTHRDTVDMKRVWHSSIETRRDLHFKLAELHTEIRSLRADVEAGNNVKHLELRVEIEASRAELAGLREGLAAWQASVEALQKERVVAETSVQALRDAAGPELSERQAFRREIQALRQELAAARAPQLKAAMRSSSSTDPLVGLRRQALGAEASLSQSPPQRLPGVSPQRPLVQMKSLSPPKALSPKMPRITSGVGAAVLPHSPSRSAPAGGVLQDPLAHDVHAAPSAEIRPEPGSDVSNHSPN